MTTEVPDTNQVAAAFHTAFVVTYTNAARQKYPKLASTPGLPWPGCARHPRRQPLVAHRLHARPALRATCALGRWVASRCRPPTRVIYPDLADLPDQSNPRKEEFRLAMDVDFFIYHEVLPPPGRRPTTSAGAPPPLPWPSAWSKSTLRRYVEVEALKAKTSPACAIRHQLLQRHLRGVGLPASPSTTGLPL